ncbi:MAG: c-type cytochrome [Alphaproteobacteria bacterium]
MQFLQGQLSAADIQAISDSLNSNPATGQQRYVTACAGCHGLDANGGRVGEGVRGASASAILGAIQEERPMGYLGCLPASDVKDIANYLQSLSGGASHDGDEGREGRYRGRSRRD